ncbi:AIR synthase family protein [Methanonatronarchaeum sp. AMET6-2]|uniref:AIR synthase family protein n=1 Tax=Methanonatronarchaeum sp. AMET6-2 TaxID=2933293 RepID=UPI0012058CFC|nr:AIR synthase family protein [Methanonatronarchaeum sp. AMET6-2]RZN62322.1 MAG: AIR synthase [Methanonatronarchaeia archaeon]UOY09582.1 AIR synthase family protein [Methanonatronarchaeum sp. AMET6-2]
MDLPEVGKIDRELFEKLIYSRLGAENPDVVIGPQHGVDAAVVETGQDDRVMVISEDPTFTMPSMLDEFGWAIVHICASDVAVLGVDPEYLTLCLLLPPKTKTNELDDIWSQIHSECKELGITVIGGHTGVYPGIPEPLNGGGTVIGFGKKEDLTPPSNAREGDEIIMTKGPAIEAAGILAHKSEEALKEKHDPTLIDKAKKLSQEMTVIKDAEIAREHANAMHDATEGGVINGVYEIAMASDSGCELHIDKIEIPREIEVVCNHHQIDPLTSISEGTLLLTTPPTKTDRVIKNLEKNNIDSWVIGKITDGKKTIKKKDGTQKELKPNKTDPFWNAFFTPE